MNIPQETIKSNINYKLHILPRPWSMEVGIWLVGIVNSRAYNCTINKNGYIEEEEIPECDEVNLNKKYKPLMVVPFNLIYRLIE